MGDDALEMRPQKNLANNPHLENEYFRTIVC